MYAFPNLSLSMQELILYSIVVIGVNGIIYLLCLFLSKDEILFNIVTLIKSKIFGSLIKHSY